MSYDTDHFGGQDSVVVHMPFAHGVRLQCVQGPFGSYSHHYDSTMHDVDLDTPNDMDLSVYAPISGTAYVHTDLDSGFGIHVNIDLGDGTYIILAHLKRADTEDGRWIDMGDLIGIEGTTGSSTGDHVHIGRHRGDASRDGTYGTSVEGLSIRAQDVNAGLQKTLSTENMVCGLVEGNVYGSLLPVWEQGPPPEVEDPGTDLVLNEPTDPSSLTEDNRILICMDMQNYASTLTAVKLYAISQSMAVQSYPFYQEGREVINQYINTNSSMAPEYCQVFPAKDDETVWVNGFAYVGPNPQSGFAPEYWRHFVQPNSAVFGYIHTYADISKRTPARDCSVQQFLYYDVNGNGPTDYNSVQRAYHCPAW